MRGKTAKAEATRAEIAGAALKLFFEKGYENTSIRMIQHSIGREVGSFYYHFASKDEAFEAAIRLFFSSYEERMRAILAGLERPEGTLSEYLDYIQAAASDFRQKYLKQLHWSVLGAIREYTLRIMRSYIGEILSSYVEKGVIPEPGVGRAVAANLIAFGVGGSILYQTDAEYRAQREGIFQTVGGLIGLPARRL